MGTQNAFIIISVLYVEISGTNRICLQEAIAIVLEVIPSMGQAAAGDCSALQTSLEAIDMILQRKVSWYRHVIKPY